MFNTHENLMTLFVLLLTPLLFIVELAPWIAAVGGTITIIWMGRQFYLSFKNSKYLKAKEAREIEKRAEEKAKRSEEKQEHELRIAILRKQLGEGTKSSEKED